MRTFIITIIIIFSSITLHSQDSIDQEKGWFGNVRLGYTNFTRVTNSQFIEGVGAEDIRIEENSYSNGLNIISGYRFNDYLSAGLGIGLDGIHNPNFNTVPLFVDFRAYTSGDENAIYLYINAGQHIDPGIKNASFQTGGLFGIGLGYQFIISKLKLQADVGFHTKNLDIQPALVANGSNRISFNGFSINLAAVVF